MKKYYENERIRKITQSVVTAIQAVLVILAATFMLLFVTTGAGSNSPDYSVTAIVVTVIFCAYYLAQLIFAAATYIYTPKRNSFDVAFLTVSVLLLPIACGIYGLIIWLM